MAIGIWRAMAIIMAKVCSVAAMVLPPGELITIMPLSVAAATSILSTPTPARPIIFKFLAAAITSAVTLEAERTIRASYSGIIARSSSAGSLSRTSHSNSSFKMSTAIWETPSAIKTFILNPPKIKTAPPHIGAKHNTPRYHPNRAKGATHAAISGYPSGSSPASPRRTAIFILPAHTSRRLSDVKK